MKISFFVIIFTFVLSMNSYVIVRGWQALPPVSVIRPFYLVTILVLFITMIVGMIFGSSMPHTTGKIISSIGFTYMILFVYLFLSFLLEIILAFICTASIFFGCPIIKKKYKNYK